jgi:adsorption protein B
MNDTVYTLARFCNIIYPILYVLAIVVGSIFAISGFTDIIFDIYYIYRSVRRFFLSKKWPKLTLERLEAREQQKIALIIACWHEEAVIAKTLANACESIHYRNYDIFVGTYPNDPDTQREVDKVSKQYPQVHKVVTADDGPTNKAANLNQVFEAIEDYEKKTGLQYEIIISLIQKM